MAKILIVDDEQLLSKSIARYLAKEGHNPTMVPSAEAALESLERERPDLIVLDMRLKGMDGLEALRRLQEIDAEIPVIIMTAFGSVETAVEAMRAGAYHYITKPLQLEELGILVARALEEAALRGKLISYQEREAAHLGFLEVVGESPAFIQVLQMVERFSQIGTASVANLPTVLLLGETGTGKDLFARLIHAKSTVASAPYVEVNCTAIPRELVEAELFGFEKGAFTDAKATKRGLFETAHGGTIFLDEIGDLDLSVQAKLLRVIEQKQIRRVGGVQDRKVEARIIAATNRNLEEEVERGAFRGDLLFRLKVLTLRLPTLRERGDDVLLLAEHFLKKFSRRYGLPLRRLSSQAVQALRRYPWPGNVRELANVLERAALLCEEDIIEPELLAMESTLRLAIDEKSRITIDFPEKGIHLEQVEKQLIEKALAAARGNLSLAARKLGIGREALRYRMQKFDIVLPQ